MSYYTVVYPKYKEEELEESYINEGLERTKSTLALIWSQLITSIKFKPIISNLKDWDEFTKHLAFTIPNLVEAYKRAYEEYFKYYTLETLRVDHNDERKPAIVYNHFEYSTNLDIGVEELTKHVEYCAERFLFIAADNSQTSKKDLEDGGTDIYRDMKELKEFLDDTLYDLCFCKLCLKYQDTIERG